MAEPTFDVRMITQRRKSTVRPLQVGEAAVVEDLQEEVPDRRARPSRTRRAGRPRTGPSRTDEISGAAVLLDARRRRAAARGCRASGTRSCRGGRGASREPNRYSASALAISVLPVPVGPTNRKTPSGRVGSVRPALTSAMRSTRQSTASGWPSTRSRKKRAHVARASSGSSGRASRAAGREARGEHASTSAASIVLAAGLGGLVRGGADEPQQRCPAARRPAGTARPARTASREQLAGRPHADAAAFQRVGADGLAAAPPSERHAHGGESARETRARLDEELPAAGDDLAAMTRSAVLE